MDFSELVEIVGNEPVFATGMLLSGDIKPDDIRRQLSRWKKAGKVYQLRRGVYSLAPPFQKITPHPFLVANRMVPASYVSLQSALAYYGLIPEYVPVTTSVTTNRPGYWETPIGVYDYRHVQVGLFSGYRLLDVGDQQRAFIAIPEKAILDLVYLHPGGDSLEYLKELRLENLNRLDWQELSFLVDRLGKPKLLRAAKHIRALASLEEEYERL